MLKLFNLQFSNNKTCLKNAMHSHSSKNCQWSNEERKMQIVNYKLKIHCEHRNKNIFED